MNGLEYYSPEQIEDMELQNWELGEKSDFDLLDELVTIRAMNIIAPDPHLDADQTAAIAEFERRGLLIDDDWECKECGDRNSFDCDLCRGCGARKGMPF